VQAPSPSPTTTLAPTPTATPEPTASAFGASQFVDDLKSGAVVAMYSAKTANQVWAEYRTLSAKDAALVKASGLGTGGIGGPASVASLDKQLSLVLCLNEDLGWTSRSGAPASLPEQYEDMQSACIFLTARLAQYVNRTADHSALTLLKTFIGYAAHSWIWTEPDEHGLYVAQLGYLLGLGVLDGQCQPSGPFAC
jgi:hypothetical protein